MITSKNELPDRITIDCREIEIGLNDFSISMEKIDPIANRSYHDLISENKSNKYHLVVMHRKYICKSGYTENNYCPLDCRSVLSKILSSKESPYIFTNGNKYQPLNLFFYTFDKNDHSLTLLGDLKDKRCIEKLSKFFKKIDTVAEKVFTYSKVQEPKISKKDKGKERVVENEVRKVDSYDGIPPPLEDEILEYVKNTVDAVDLASFFNEWSEEMKLKQGMKFINIGCLFYSLHLGDLYKNKWENSDSFTSDESYTTFAQAVEFYHTATQPSSEKFIQILDFIIEKGKDLNGETMKEIDLDRYRTFKNLVLEVPLVSQLKLSELHNNSGKEDQAKEYFGKFIDLLKKYNEDYVESSFSSEFSDYGKKTMVELTNWFEFSIEEIPNIWGFKE